MFARKITAEEIAAREAEFQALPLIEQIRIVVRQEISRAMASRDDEKRRAELRVMHPSSPFQDPLAIVHIQDATGRFVKDQTGSD